LVGHRNAPKGPGVPEDEVTEDQARNYQHPTNQDNRNEHDQERGHRGNDAKEQASIRPSNDIVPQRGAIRKQFQCHLTVSFSGSAADCHIRHIGNQEVGLKVLASSLPCFNCWEV
jgi:hypothetical protein